MRISELDYELPASSIAVRPAEPRDHSCLMVVRMRAGAKGNGSYSVEHRRFYELTEFLRAGDLLVTNDTRVLPAKLDLQRQTGAVIPGLFVMEEGIGAWRVMLRSRGKVRAGETLVARGGAYQFLLEERLGEGLWRVAVSPEANAGHVLAAIGAVPLPPYIEKARREGAGGLDAGEARDREWYQTVYAAGTGKSVAAPTAGLHFTPGLLQRISALGVRRVGVELDVGLGTFLPVEVETLEAHRMHREHYRVPAETVTAVREQRRRGGRIVVVGTTAVRALESAAASILDENALGEISGETELKIAPGYAFRLTDVLITNFHLPKSTLMALVGALVGVANLKELYTLAVREGYRFYSYGDAMILLRP